MLYDTCCSDSGKLIDVTYRETEVCVFGLRVGLHAYNYLFGVIHQT